MKEENAFDSINIIMDDLEAYIEERRWDETSNGGESRDKHNDILVARSLRAILPEINYIKTMKDNPSFMWLFRHKTLAAFGIWVALFVTSYIAIRLAEIAFGLDTLVKAALGL